MLAYGFSARCGSTLKPPGRPDMTDDGLDRLIERLDRLERADRRRTLTSAAIVVLLVAGIGLAAAAPRSPQPGPEGPPLGSAVSEIRAKRLVLVDDAGKLSAVLGFATRGAVSLGLLDNDDKIRAVLIVDANGI